MRSRPRQGAMFVPMLGGAKEVTLAAKSMSTTTPIARGRNGRTCVAGEFLVAGELAKRDWVVTLTAKNTAGFDIVATRPESNSDVSVRIDVKTRRPQDPQAWRIGGIHITGPHDFVVLVGLGDEDQVPTYRILPAREARRLVTNDQLRLTSVREYEDRWDLLDA